MKTRTRITAAELHKKWMSPESCGMVHDHSTQEVVVEMLDGTAYSCTFAEKRAAADDL